MQLGLHGLCQSNYAVEENTESEMIITQVVDFSNCREKAELISGIAMAVPDRVAAEVSKIPNPLGSTFSAFFVSTFRTSPTDEQQVEPLKKTEIKIGSSSHAMIFRQDPAHHLWNIIFI